MIRKVKAKKSNHQLSEIKVPVMSEAHIRMPHSIIKTIKNHNGLIALALIMARCKWTKNGKTSNKPSEIAQTKFISAGVSEYSFDDVMEELVSDYNVTIEKIEDGRKMNRYYFDFSKYPSLNSSESDIIDDYYVQVQTAYIIGGSAPPDLKKLSLILAMYANRENRAIHKEPKKIAKEINCYNPDAFQKLFNKYKIFGGELYIGNDDDFFEQGVDVEESYGKCNFGDVRFLYDKLFKDHSFKSMEEFMLLQKKVKPWNLRSSKKEKIHDLNSDLRQWQKLLRSNETQRNKIVKRIENLEDQIKLHV